MNAAGKPARKLTLLKTGHHAYLVVNAVLLAAAVLVIWQFAGKPSSAGQTDIVTQEGFNESLEWLDKKEAQ